MAKRVGQKIKMTSIDELLCVPSVAGCDEIEVAKIRPFKDHPFKVLDDEKMHELVESIMLNGVPVPVTVMTFPLDVEEISPRSIICPLRSSQTVLVTLSLD